MSDLIELTNGDLTASIDPQGAWLVALRAGEQDVLFSRQTFTLPDGSSKVRGGSHVCFPNFGPGSASGLAQHGFGRELLWTVVNTSADSVELELAGPEGDYAAVTARLRYDLGVDGITMTLHATNDGSAAVPICPGFHPYFATEATASTVDGTAYDHAPLSDAVFLEEPASRLETGGRAFDLQQQNLPQWVLWTDGLAGYVCLEPTAAGFGFVDGVPLQLAPETGWSGSLHIAINV